MEPIVEKILSTGSPLAILVVIVWLFLRFQEKQGEINRTTYVQQGELNRVLFQSFFDSSHNSRVESTQAMKENAANTKENTQVLRQVEVRLTELAIAAGAVKK